MVLVEVAGPDELAVVQLNAFCSHGPRARWSTVRVGWERVTPVQLCVDHRIGHG
jgi:hypothetical protein